MMHSSASASVMMLRSISIRELGGWVGKVCDAAKQSVYDWFVLLQVGLCLAAGKYVGFLMLFACIFCLCSLLILFMKVYAAASWFMPAASLFMLLPQAAGWISIYCRLFEYL